MTIKPQDLTRTERSILLYAETTMVDYGGLLEGPRMNADDHAALDRLQAAGMLTWGRVPGRLLGHFIGRNITHWVEFTDAGWTLAQQTRRYRCEITRKTSRNYLLFKSEVEMNQAIEDYYRDRANGYHAAKAP